MMLNRACRFCLLVNVHSSLLVHVHSIAYISAHRLIRKTYALLFNFLICFYYDTECAIIQH
ncbi:hypothetical protein HMPREF3190_01419 [Umbribacter vaginalis]|nr:hypothetical protein HMPREF3190_01419 [Coriobacteriales bacterium DNF00809]